MTESGLNTADTIRLSFEKELYSLDSVKKTVYKFAADCAAIISSDEVNYVVTLTMKNPNEKESLIRAFCSELIDQDLRAQIKAETEATRNLILAEAFSRTSLMGEN